MRYRFSLANLSANKGLQKEIEAASHRLANKLSKLDLNALDISDYNKRYFGDILNGIRAALQLRSYLLFLCLDGSDKPKQELTFIDYGGGSGILSLLAKEFGIGTVVYDDIYDVSCRDAKIIGDSIGLSADYYVNGDIEELITFLHKSRVTPNCMGSYDVLEHIYDIPGFLSKLELLSNGALTIVMGSGANPHNPYINRVLMKKQLYLENIDREAAWGSKDRDTTRSYLSLRKDMIISYAKSKGINLDYTQMEELAKKTRGLMRPEIEKAIECFINSGEMPKQLEHPTNTCDPRNGNWAEHLMCTNELADILSRSGFESEIIRGYYGDSRKNIKKMVGRLFNFCISIMGQRGLFFSPFYILYGRKMGAK